MNTQSIPSGGVYRHGYPKLTNLIREHQDHYWILGRWFPVERVWRNANLNNKFYSSGSQTVDSIETHGRHVKAEILDLTSEAGVGRDLEPMFLRDFGSGANEEVHTQ